MCILPTRKILPKKENTQKRGSKLFTLRRRGEADVCCCLAGDKESNSWEQQVERVDVSQQIHKVFGGD